MLDVGCGTGLLALVLAGRGLAVLGVDLAEAPLARARAGADTVAPEVGPVVEFRVGDAQHPAALPGAFGAVIDSGFFHPFGPIEQEQFAQELAAALVNGGRYYLLVFAIASPLPAAPRQVLESELRALFAPSRGGAYWLCVRIGSCSGANSSEYVIGAAYDRSGSGPPVGDLSLERHV